MTGTPRIGWPFVSRFAGLTIVTVVMVMYVLAWALNRPLDKSIGALLLSIATSLLLGPSGLQLVIRSRNGRSSDSSPPDGSHGD